MKDDISDIRAMYESDPGHEADRLDRHRLEYDLIWRYLEEYLPSQGHILELGPGPGRYTVELARRGYTVTAQDLSTKMIALTRENLENAGLADRVRLLEGDVRDLSRLGETAFDAALVMGPLYHLIYESDRRLVLEQVFDLLTSGAPIASAFLSRFGIWGHIMKNQPEQIWRAADHVSVRERGYDPPRRGAQANPGFRGYFATAEELAPLHESEGFETVAVAGVEPAIGAEDASYNDLDEPMRAAWLEFLFEISTEPSIVGASRHMLYIGRKPTTQPPASI